MNIGGRPMEDNVKLLDVIVVGIPEVFLVYLTSIVLINGNIFVSKDYNLKLILKILLTSTIYSLLLIIIRKNINSFIAIGCISMLFIIATLRFVFQFNYRQALICGYLVMLIILFCETLSTPIVNLMRIKYSGYYFDYRFLFTIPTRIFQIVALFICLVFNLKSSEILNIQWRLLSKSKKKTFYSIVLLIVSTYLFSANYTETYMKIDLYNIDVKEIFFNIQIFFIETIAFMIVIIILLSRTIQYEEYRDILSSPRKAFERLLYNSTEKEIYYYLSLTKDYLNVIGIDMVEELLKKMKAANKNIYYHIDKSLEMTGYNFKKIYFLLEMFKDKVLGQVTFENTIITLELKDNIGFNLKIILNDIERRKLLKIIEQDLDMENLKFSIVEEGAEYRINKDKYFELEICVPYNDLEKHIKN
jgi:hypothetical protein